MNHFGRNREITTKTGDEMCAAFNALQRDFMTGLTSNLRHSYSVYNLIDMNQYYPRAYDLGDSQGVGEFILVALVV